MWRADGPVQLVVGRASLELHVPAAPHAGRSPAPADFRQALDHGPGEGGVDAQVLQALDSLISAALAHCGEGLRGRPLRVVVSARWLSAAMLPWSEALTRPAPAQVYACDQLRASGFDITPGDRVHIEDAPYRSVRLAVAYPARLLIGLQEAARRTGLVLQAVTGLPLVAAAYAQSVSRATTGFLALVDGAGVSFMRWDRGSYAPVGNEVALPPGAELAAELPKIWRRQVLRGALQGQDKAEVGVLDLADGRSGSDLSKLDGFRPLDLPVVGAGPMRSRLLRLAATSVSPSSSLTAVIRSGPTDRRLVLLAVAAGLLAAAAVFQATRVMLEVRTERAALANLSPSPPQIRRAPSSREGLARVASINTAIASLNMPISELLHALQPPPDIRVALLSLEAVPPTVVADAAGGDALLKLNAEAASESEMARYVMFVGSRRPFVEAYLTNHETHESDRTRPYRFTVEALWRP